MQLKLNEKLKDNIHATTFEDNLSWFQQHISLKNNSYKFCTLIATQRQGSS
ncbi:hypothetical protein Syun_019060 [Stephania yunnanensis]|uniref:Uncharacterized protein n=1 Tax=Stephania yunnanensis TaxID=152371 RepID=A0AAP0IV20_9MAGN